MLPPAQIVCIQNSVYTEARGESDLGKRGVVHVILNRSKQSNKTPCEVLRQPGQFSVRHRLKYSSADFRNIHQIALYPGNDPTRGALYFKSRHCRVRWKHTATKSIGGQTFYK